MTDKRPELDEGSRGIDEVTERSAPRPSPPAISSTDFLPSKLRRLSPGGPECSTVSLVIEVCTDTLGGGSQTRRIDDVEYIRPATARGHLRFWWRALHVHEHASSSSLFAAESRLWGCASQKGTRRSDVELRIEVLNGAEVEVDESNVAMSSQAAYALWTARAEKESGTAPAPRRRPGTRFRLTLVGPREREKQLRDAIRAWLLFGGYGSRVRRGLGCLTVVEDPDDWLPKEATASALSNAFGYDIFAAPMRPAVECPRLAGAALFVARPQTDAPTAWIKSLGWLKTFRQGSTGEQGSRAREPGRDNRPSVSNWPEPDKIRHHHGKTAAHPPRHNEVPAWPRAAFGLPITGRFQTKARNKTTIDEPPSFELRWKVGDRKHHRLASPLILKALPLADGKFAPSALWLERSLPQNAEVGLARMKNGGEWEVDPNTACPFDRLVAPGDVPRFSALAGRSSLREAFLDWLKEQPGVEEVAR